MAEIRPFAAYRYNPAKVDLSRVVTQPYDKITPAMQQQYYAASPHNFIAVEKGLPHSGDSPTENVYTRAAEKLDEWIAGQILVREPSPAMYIYSQDYTVPGTQTRRVRTGLIALGRLEDYDAGVIFPHEKTLPTPKVDRLELLRHTRAQTGQLFFLFEDPSRALDALFEETSRQSPAVELRDESQVVHRLWQVVDPSLLSNFSSALADKKLVIADGHHRYETALSFRNECRQRLGAKDPNAPYKFAMMTLFNTHSKGLTILPTHRLIQNQRNFDFARFRQSAKAYFDWYAYPFRNSEERIASYSEFRRDLEGRGRAAHAIGVYSCAGAFYLFVLRKGAELEQWLPDVSTAVRELDVIILHRLLLEKCLGVSSEGAQAEKNVAYEREMDAAIAAVDRQEAQMACLLNPVRVQQVMNIALGGEVLPQKSTDFYPKLLSGIAIYRF